MQLTVKIDAALEALRTNLEAHKAELSEAMINWTKQTMDALEEMRDAVSRKGLEASWEKLNHLMYKKPIDNRLHYSKFISALELSKAAGQEEMTINEDDYDRMFSDNWEWRNISRTSNRGYIVQH